MQIKSPITSIVFSGIKSENISKKIASNKNIMVCSEEDSFGLDKNKVLFLFDKNTKRKRKNFINQSFRNNTNYPHSIAILQTNFERSIVNQICADYFENFNRNIDIFGFPWGKISKKHEQENNLYLLERNEDPMFSDVANFLKKNGVFKIEFENYKQIVSWLNNSKINKCNIFAMVCPDYSFDYDQNKNILRYSTENKLEEGIGLVAIKTLDFLEDFGKIISKYKLDIEMIIGIADYEDYESNLKRLNETKESFNKKIEKSISKIKEECFARKIKADVFSIRKYFGEELFESVWIKSNENIREKLKILSEHQLNKMIENRKKLYSKWFPNILDKEVFERFINQGTEYTTCGDLFSKKIDNLLILGTNSINMELFYKLNAPNTPVLYVTNVHK